MKKPVLTILILFSFFCGEGQIAVADSLKRVLSSSNPDTLTVFTLCRISNAYYYVNADSSMVYAKEANALATKIKFVKGEWQSLNLIGNILKSNGDFPNALKTHLEVLQKGEALKNEMYIAISYNNIAEVYKEQGDYSNAIAYYRKAKDIFQKINSPYLVNAYLNIGDNYEMMNRVDSALLYQNQAHQLAMQLQDKNNLGAILTNLGNINIKLKQRDLGKSYYRASIPYAIETDDKQTLYNAYLGIARLFKEDNQIDSSFTYAKAALGFAQEISNLKGVNQCATLLYQLYSLRNNTDSAFQYFKLATFSRDSMFTEEKVREVQKLNFTEQQRQETIAELAEKESKERSYNLQMLGVAIFLLVFFMALVFMSRKKMKPKTIEYLGLMGLLLLFEFITYFLHPFIAHITHHIPIFILLCTVTIVAILVPLHHKLESWVKHKLAHRPSGNLHKPLHTSAPVSIKNTQRKMKGAE